MKLGGTGIKVGSGNPLLLIAGPCAIEGSTLLLEIAGQVRDLCRQHGFNFVFKASFDKANRSSHLSYRGPGLADGLKALSEVRSQLKVPVLTDVHEHTPLDEVAAVVDVLQTPAMLCRQSDYIAAVAACKKPVNIKKGQFLSPPEMRNVVAKARAAGNEELLVCERGFCFGYGDLVADMRSLVELRACNCPVVFDATHSVQRPGGLGHASSGRREFVPALARAAVATGVDGLFIETHPNPDQALSDGPNSWPLDQLGSLLQTLAEIDQAVKSRPGATD